MNTETEAQRSRALVVAAFAAIYLVWGSTYLAIRVVVETMPPFLSAAVRFLIAGGLLYAFLIQRGTQTPDRSQWRHAAVTGTFLLVGGNGLVVWAERSISSGLTALLVALAPVWFALLEWIRPKGQRPPARTVIGIGVGFSGVLMLVSGRGTGAQEHAHWAGAAAVIIAGLCWAAGSLYSKYSPNSGSPWMNAAAQMVCGGAGLLVVALLRGEPIRTEWSRISGHSIAALGYLIVFGSWIGFSAYVWLLKASTPTRVSTYAYINPVIAVFLGWALLGETVNSQMLGGAAVILAGVIIITVPAAVVYAAGRESRRALERIVLFSTRRL